MVTRIWRDQVHEALDMVVGVRSFNRLGTPTERGDRLTQVQAFDESRAERDARAEQHPSAAEFDLTVVYTLRS